MSHLNAGWPDILCLFLTGWRNIWQWGAVCVSLCVCGGGGKRFSKCIHSDQNLNSVYVYHENDLYVFERVFSTLWFLCASKRGCGNSFKERTGITVTVITSFLPRTNSVTTEEPTVGHSAALCEEIWGEWAHFCSRMSGILSRLVS